MGNEPLTIFEGLLSPAPSFCICSSLLRTHNQRSAVWTVGHALAALQPPSFPCVLDGPLSTVPLGEPWRLPGESLPPPTFPGSVTACLQSLGSRVLGGCFPLSSQLRGAALGQDWTVFISALQDLAGCLPWGYFPTNSLKKA